MGLVGVFTAPSISNLTSIPVSLQFQRYEEAVAVTGLDASDLSAVFRVPRSLDFPHPTALLSLSILFPMPTPPLFPLTCPEARGLIRGIPLCPLLCTSEWFLRYKQRTIW